MEKYIAISFISIIFLVAISQNARGQEAVFFKTRELSFELGKYAEGSNRDALVGETGGKLTAATNLNWNVDMLCTHWPRICWKWDNTIMGKTIENKYILTGWHFESGLDFGPIELLYSHTSRHTLDRVPATGAERKYDNENLYMIRLNFIRNPRTWKRDGLME